MKTEWQQEQLSRLPSEFEKVNETTYIQRKDITEIPPDGQSTSTRYTCTSRFVSEDVKDQIELIQDIVHEMGGTTPVDSTVTDEILDKADAFDYITGGAE